jgi:hypothetical protein
MSATENDVPASQSAERSLRSMTPSAWFPVSSNFAMRGRGFRAAFLDKR